MSIRAILISALALCCSWQLEAQTERNEFATDDITDLALIWCGGPHRPDWNKEIFTPFVVHTYADGRRTWLFDGFLFIESYAEDALGQGYRYASGGNGGPATREMWEFLLDKQLGTDGNGCRALDNLIEDLKLELGTPSHKHKVVLTIPMPIRGFQVWGRIDGKNFDFRDIEDRVKAMEWFADLIERRWAEENFRNLELEGVYWLDEDLYNSDDVAKAMSPYYHSKGWKLYWIPYFPSNRLRNFWADYGFDVTYLQPNYYFTTDVPYERLPTAVAEAYQYGMGLEFEFEGFYGAATAPQWNTGMYDYSPGFYQRLVDYVDVFETYGVFDFSAISWYSGYKGFYDFAMSTNPKDHEIMDRIALLIENRHIEAGWHERTEGGIDITENDGKAIVYGADGYIYLSDKIAGNARVYNAAGQLIHDTGAAITNDGAERMHYGVKLPVPPGIYIVATPTSSVKVAVR